MIDGLVQQPDSARTDPPGNEVLAKAFPSFHRVAEGTHPIDLQNLPAAISARPPATRLHLAVVGGAKHAKSSCIDARLRIGDLGHRPEIRDISPIRHTTQAGAVASSSRPDRLRQAV